MARMSVPAAPAGHWQEGLRRALPALVPACCSGAQIQPTTPGSPGRKADSPRCPTRSGPVAGRRSAGRTRPRVPPGRGARRGESFSRKPATDTDSARRKVPGRPMPVRIKVRQLGSLACSSWAADRPSSTGRSTSMMASGHGEAGGGAPPLPQPPLQPTRRVVAIGGARPAANGPACPEGVVETRILAYPVVGDTGSAHRACRTRQLGKLIVAVDAAEAIDEPGLCIGSNGVHYALQSLVAAQRPAMVQPGTA
jgi:hypothetical protein